MKQKLLYFNNWAHGLLAPLVLLLIWLGLYLSLQRISNFLIDQVFQLEAGTHFTEALRFFIFEVPKVLLLLVLIIFLVGVVRTFFTPEKTRKALEGKSLFTGNVLASLLGVVTPFCSCSAIPLFLGFVEAGIPLGVTFSFLISAPMVNEVAVVLLLGLFGWKVMLIYISTGLLIAIVSGFILQKIRMEKYVAEWAYQVKTNQQAVGEIKISLQERISKGFESVKEIVGKIWIYIVVGIAVGAGAHGYVPEDFLTSLLGKGNWYSVPVAILIGVPMYSNAAGIIPIISVLIEKGVSLGTALAFMMSVIALSLPEIIILKKVLKWPLIAAFVGVVTTGIIIVGYMFNFLF
ncbi:MAG: hypothetical protein A2W84_10475 [Bacteroidetes bacterium GWC2_40_13]|jgi:hypothetical protein|nr:MAG: hypothetical protein A2W84_10475 [Bacteroidetes bacterium GWC2_40_13]